MDLLERHFALCRVCGQVVFRIPGQMLGDGEQDTAENPVWLWYADPEEIDFPGVNDLPVIDCGCSE